MKRNNRLNKIINDRKEWLYKERIADWNDSDTAFVAEQYASQSVPQENAGVWVKASDRLPPINKDLHLKIIGKGWSEGLIGIGNFNGDYFSEKGLGSLDKRIIEWLDESPQSVPPTPVTDAETKKCIGCGHELPIAYFDNGTENCYLCYTPPVTDKPFNEDKVAQVIREYNKLLMMQETEKAYFKLAYLLNEVVIEWAANKDSWISVEDDLPKVENKPFLDSDYVLCRDENKDNIPFVAWYNHKEDKWTVANYLASSISIAVTHWQPLPNKPIK